MEELSLIEAIKDVIWEKIDNLRIVKLYRRTRFRLFNFFSVARRYKQYQEVIGEIYNPWFDITEGSNMLYMSNQDNLYCMFCGVKYVSQWQGDDWLSGKIETQKHHEKCTWLKIEKLRTW